MGNGPAYSQLFWIWNWNTKSISQILGLGMQLKYYFQLLGFGMGTKTKFPTVGNGKWQLISEEVANSTGISECLFHVHHYVEPVQLHKIMFGIQLE